MNETGGTTPLSKEIFQSLVLLALVAGTVGLLVAIGLLAVRAFS